MSSNEILTRIINKGGLYGQIAAKTITPDKVDNFIIECFGQCHNRSTQILWGNELVMDLIRYRLELIRQPLRELETIKITGKRAFEENAMYK